MKKSALWLAMAAAVAFGFTATSCSDDPDHPDKNVLETPMMQAPQLTSNSATSPGRNAPTPTCMYTL